MLLEVCVDSLASARAAIAGGADRLELCSALLAGGLTPYTELLRQIRHESDVAVRCLIRPRAGDFLYMPEEIEMMCAQITELRSAGANGFVIGCLNPDGTLDIDRMLEHVDKNTILVACMMVNNEVGTRNDVERLAAEVKRRNSRTIVHVDAVQAWMRVPIKLANIDTLAVSGHKIHAPKGIGALYLSDSLYQAFQAPYLGGEQEREKRPGTENLPYALGLAAAATRLNKTMKSRDAAVRALNLRLREGLKAFPEVVINSPDNAVPEVLNFSEMCIKSETMLAFLAEEQIYVSSASACGRGQPSHTLAAMGRDPLAIDTAIRVSFCADNTPEDVDAFLNRFEDGMKHLQKIRK